MELKRIPLEDIYPDEANPRSKESMGDLGALADSFALNAINPGEPVNPIVVVADGGIWRIVDGERRYRAMKRLGKDSCMAVACEGMDEAGAMLSMLATDDKERLTDMERSRGVQQMLLLGVDPEKVERAGRMAKGTAGRVRRAMKEIDDAAEDMSLDRLLAIEELADDDEAVEALTLCREQDWRREYDAIVRKREVAEKRAALREACEAAGLPVAGDEPDGMRYAGLVRSPVDVAQMAERLPEGSLAVDDGNEWSAYVELYRPASDEEAERDAESEAWARRRDALVEARDAVAARRKKWYARRIENGTHAMGAVATLLLASARKRNAASYYRTFADVVAGFEEETGVEVPIGLSPALAAWVWEKNARDLGESPAVLSGGVVEAGDAEKWLAWTAAFERDGYEPDEADEAMKEACLQAAKDEEE